MVSVDTVLELLHSEQRRYALYYLNEQDNPVSMDELAEEVAKMEGNDNKTDLSDEEIHRYKVDLYHSELPKAADEAEFIEYDPDDGIVSLTDEPPEFEAILSVAEVVEKPL